MSQGVVHEDLRLLLETYLPSKKKKVLLGVGDPKIGAAIQEELGYNCQTGGVIAEVLRGEIALFILTVLRFVYVGVFACIMPVLWVQYP